LNAEVFMHRWLVISTVFLASAVPAGAQFVAPGAAVPAVASLPGANDTFWRSNVNVLNLNSEATRVVLVLYPEIKNSGPVFDIQESSPIDIAGNGQVTISNVVTSVFGERNKKGALYVYSLDGSYIAVSSRTYTPAPAPAGGSYGLNVSGVLVADTAWIAGVEDEGLTGFFRTSVGVFVPAGPSEGQEVGFTVTVYDSDGVELASGSLIFDQAGMQQKFLAGFGLDEPLLDGWVKIRCHDPLALWYAYATVTDNASGDAVYRPALTRQSSIP
jgi:hypothetical protein